MRYALILSFVVLISCSTAPPIDYYDPPDDSVGTAAIYKMESPPKFMIKGHEKIFVCAVDGEMVEDAVKQEYVRVAPGSHRITICYKVGLNRAVATFEGELQPSTRYQIKLGEFKYTILNFSIEYKDTGKIYLANTSVPINSTAAYEIFLPTILLY